MERLPSEQSLRCYSPSEAEVRLTRFSSLDKITQPIDSQTSRNSPPRDGARRSKATGTLQVASRASFEDTSKWPWRRAQRCAQEKSAESLDELATIGELRRQQQQILLEPDLPAPQLADAEAARTGRANEAFQVIWSQLAFEVNTWTYDQLLGRALGRLKAALTRRRPDIVSSAIDEQCATKNSTNKSSLDRRLVFENLNGHIKSGEISAILGPSGAGKTSLLNAICSQASNGTGGSKYRGRVRLVAGSSSRMRVSVIPQKDYLVDRLTVQENLLFASRMLNPDRGFDHEANILHLAKMLNLTSCLRSSTGSISGGEYKRVSIAQELLKRPDLLILDEPTSGLDSVNCKNLVRSLRSLIDASRRGAINPIAIVLTIHQPDVEIFHMFDHIYCMARAGRTIYEGHPSKALEVIRAHSGIGGAADWLSAESGNVNPANLLIEIASEFVYGPEPIERLNKFQLKQFEHQNQHKLLRPAFRGSWASMANHLVGGAGNAHQSASKLSLDLAAGEQPATMIGSNKSSASFSLSVHSFAPSMSTATSASGFSAAYGAASTKTSKGFVRDKRLNSKVDHSGKFLHQMALLTRRNFTADMRDPLMTGAAIIFHLIIPIVMWVAYSQRIGSVKACPVIHREMELLALANEGTAAKLAELQEEFAVALECSTMFFLVSYCFSLRSLSMAALSFPLSMHVLVKESRNGWYNVTAYVLAKTLSTLLTEVLLPVLSVVLIYYVMDMPAAPYQWRLWAVALVMALVSLVSTSQGLIWGAISMDSIQTAIFMGSASSLPLVLLSGFTARIKQMPVFMQNLSWISPYRYSSDAINLIRFGFGLCPCDAAMDDYLKRRPATFSDLPDRMKPLFTFYLTNNAPDSSEDSAANNVTALLNNTDQQQPIAGISYDLVLNSTVRNDMLRKLETNEVDLFAKMAELLSKSFSYGREIKGCESVRSQLLDIGGFPDDHYLPAYFAGLAVMFLLLNILLFLVVKSKVSKRV